MGFWSRLLNVMRSGDDLVEMYQESETSIEEIEDRIMKMEI